MNSLFEESAEDYLKLIENWKDPWPDPVIEDHEGFLVVRDDLLNAGSKVRFLDFLISSKKEINEWVFGSCPATGYAQISLPIACRRHGKKAVLFMAKRDMNKLHPYQQRGIKEGTIYHWIENGMLPVTQKRARDYAAESSDRMVLPLGLEHPTVLASIIKVAQGLSVIPKEVWTVGSSGTLNRGLQLAWPSAMMNVVSVGHTMKPHEIGRATLYKSPYKFDRPVKENEMPPYPSAPTYDAKVWTFVKQYASPGALIWNVGA